MGFIYPRVVSVWRPIKTGAGTLGDVGYNSLVKPGDYTPVLEGAPASIQLDRIGQHNPVGLPTDAAYKPIWKILIPKAAASLGLIKSNDEVTDDTAVRYQIVAPYWNSLGFQLRCIVLEV